MKLSSALIDETAALAGAWVGALTGLGDAEFLIAALDCPEAQRLQSELYKALAVSRRDRDNPQLRDYVLARCLVDVCVKDWRNIDIDGDDQPDPFDREALRRLLFKKRLPDFPYPTKDGLQFNEAGKIIFEALLEAAGDVRARRAGDDAAEKKP